MDNNTKGECTWVEARGIMRMVRSGMRLEEGKEGADSTWCRIKYSPGQGSKTSAYSRIPPVILPPQIEITLNHAPSCRKADESEIAKSTGSLFIFTISLSSDRPSTPGSISDEPTPLQYLCIVLLEPNFFISPSSRFYMKNIQLPGRSEIISIV